VRLYDLQGRRWLDFSRPFSVCVVPGWGRASYTHFLLFLAGIGLPLLVRPTHADLSFTCTRSYTSTLEEVSDDNLPRYRLP
jgi:hypothetical protein